MPHLSPMNWIIVPLFMIVTLLLMMIILWWQFLPQFPQINRTAAGISMTKSWNWW
uniref:ATP synthase F0 subunit 8 n=1 Tax=Platynereis cf. australis PA-2020 TaxID=2759233 RepID=A0A7G9UIY4_9ANNE|nr:ATP synthase F0 subunit 8 [Platynereis cf. australis PA-2020]QNN93065.1 ATP synthase F0 subunit 8 [Platynereis cf. australis PA-2020]QNN93078.1 ATP synthase F0 subunit 8 [Platynereis cf. australis PA-2020]QNN93091.1 ATP synthase F0 subunit 8 [Platynereis cf. australis PA-2020]